MAPGIDRVDSISANPSLETWLRLARAPGVGPRLAAQLLNSFGSPDRILGAPEERLREVSGMGAGRARSLRDPSLADRVRREIDRAERLGLHFLTLDDEAYPAALRNLPFPPPVLTVRGRLRDLDALALTVVGPRAPSDYARRMTQRLIPPLVARGLTVVSGLAQGIDAEAHTAALNAGGRTLAVLGQGLDTPLFPSSNLPLAERIVREDQGALISPFSLGERPQPGLFPQRNELLAALGLGLLIVEAGDRSGALITARHALDFGHTVMAVPGDADRRTARGSNRLLAEGAALVQTSDDVLASLSPELRRTMGELDGELAGTERSRNEAGDSPDGRTASSSPGGARRAEAAAPPFPSDALARQIGDLLTEEQCPLDFILQRCAEAGFGHSAVIQRLLELEMAGVLTQLPGRIYGRRW